MCVHTQGVCEDQRTVRVLFSPFAVCGLGIELRSTGVATLSVHETHFILERT